jgi:hypothetical protein
VHGIAVDHLDDLTGRANAAACYIIHAAMAAPPSAIAAAPRERRVRADISIDVETESRVTWRSRYILKFHAIYCLRSEERGPIMDMVLSFLI